jgi:hypothetical protein
MPQLRVNQVLETADPYTPKGKTYQVREWKVNGSIDGATPTELIVKTLSGKKECQVVLGWVGTVERDEYQGVVKWKIPTPKQGESAPQHSAQQSQAQQGQPPAQQPARASGGPTFDEVAALYSRCFAHVLNMLPDNTPADCLSSMTATLFIGVRDAGVRLNTNVPPVAPPAAPPTAPPTAQNAPDMDTQIGKALTDAGLLDAVKAAQITRRILHEAWIGSATDLEFTTKVIEALPKPAPVAEEDLPF